MSKLSLQFQTTNLICMVRPRTQTFTPLEWEKLTDTEKQLRGELATIKRSIKVREERIKKNKEEKKALEKRLEDLTKKMKAIGLYFPNITIEEYQVKDRWYFRGVYSVEGKKQQAYLGSRVKVFKELEEKEAGFNDMKNRERTKIITEYLEPRVKLHYWNNQYERKNS